MTGASNGQINDATAPFATSSSGTVSSVNVSGGTTGITTSGGPVTSSGTITLLVPSATSSASTVVARDANQNAFANNFASKVANVTATGGITHLTAASAHTQNLTGSGTHAFFLPDATTLTVGFEFSFNNNSDDNLLIADFNNTSPEVCQIPQGGKVLVELLSNSTSSGVWQAWYYLAAAVPSGVNGLYSGDTHRAVLDTNAYNLNDEQGNLFMHWSSSGGGRVSNDFAPQGNNSHNLGDSSNYWANTYSEIFTGNQFNGGNFSGDGSGLTGISAGSISGLAQVAITGNYSDLNSTPSFANIAFSGSYNDLFSAPMDSSGNMQTNFNDNGNATTFNGQMNINGGIVASSSSGITQTVTTGLGLTQNGQIQFIFGIAVSSQDCI